MLSRLSALSRLPALAFLGFAFASSLTSAAETSSENGSNRAATPNLVFIFADDLGYGDISCYGAELIDTPNIDKLATEGMRFTDAHTAASLCSPSRYGMLTGYSPWRLHKKGNGYRLPQSKTNIASLLQSNGYRTAAIGKWHLGYSKDWNKLPITGPLECGFDYHFGVPSNHNDGFRVFIENHDLVGRKPGVPYQRVDGQQFPDGVAQPRVEDQVDTTLTQKALQFIRESADGPFFLYFTPCAPHTHVTPAEEFRGTSPAGTLGDYIQELDHHVGEIVALLEELNLADDTLLIMTSDNGGSPKDFTGTHGTVVNLASEAGDLRNKYRNAKNTARKRGHLTNGPFHDGKGHPYEGGHRVPFIARWPGKIKAGATSPYVFNMTDMVATAADLIGVELPDDAGEDSFSLLPVLLSGQPLMPRPPVLVQGNGKDSAIAVCTGQWKMIEWTTAGGAKSHELFDLSTDTAETTNVAIEHPEIVSELSAVIQQAEASGRTRPARATDGA